MTPQQDPATRAGRYRGMPQLKSSAYASPQPCIRQVNRRATSAFPLAIPTPSAQNAGRPVAFGAPPPEPPLVIYSSRTHSQLAQVIRELRSTSYRRGGPPHRGLYSRGRPGSKALRNTGMRHPQTRGQWQASATATEISPLPDVCCDHPSPPKP
jgi:hypothetical protein